MKIHQVEQGTPEWFELRKGKMTASHAAAIANAKAGLKTYIYDVMADQHSIAEKEYFTNRHTERGNELEPLARMRYEFVKGCTVEEVGFVEHNKYIGCSPDGFVGDDGGIEIKCHDDSRHLRMLVNGPKEIERKYIWQIQMNLLLTGRKWWDYVAYNPNFEENLIIHRIEPSEDDFEALETGFKVGEKLIKQINKEMKKYEKIRS